MTILLADDHFMTLEGYISILNDESNTYIKAQNCEELYSQILCLDQLDVAIIDYDMPIYEERNISSGLDCTSMIKERFPYCNIILITAHEEAFILYGIYRNKTIDALIVKSDFSAKTLQDLILNNKGSETFYSPIAKESIKKVIAKNTLLDPKNREILMYLSHGYKITQLESFVFLSVSAIQKRISKMLHEFNVTDYQELIQIIKHNQLL
ncbi:response regulator [Myroides odoratimimus]|uniref:response regulator n=1 Tax=Myroides odoratimimus TaxID=76832 RepID=UPI003101A129